MEEIERSPKLRKPIDIARESLEEHFLIGTLLVGFVIIAVSIRYSTLGWDGVLVGPVFITISVMENIGAALFIPALVVWLYERVSRTLRARPPIKVYLKDMKSELRMMGTSLYDVHKKPKDFEYYLSKIIKSKRKLSFKFLLIDPEGRSLELRAEEEKKEKKEEIIEKYREEIAKTAEQLKNIKFAPLSPDCEFKIYTYDVPATHSLIWIDETMYVGPYLRGAAGYETPWIRITSKEKYYYELLKKDFEENILKDEKTKELKEEKDFVRLLKYKKLNEA